MASHPRVDARSGAPPGAAPVCRVPGGTPGEAIRATQADHLANWHLPLGSDRDPVMKVAI